MKDLSRGGKQGKKADKSRLRYVGLAMFLLFALTVFLYVSRLEAHTNADIFLPLNYHSALDTSGLENDALNSYYQGYAAQEGRPYTIRQDLLLSRLAYIKAPQGFRGESDGVTVQALLYEVQRVLRDDTADALQLFGREREEILDIISAVAEHPVLGELVIRDCFENRSGLAGYVLEKGDAITIALRGTDDMIDMLDNVLLLPFNLSVQYADMRRLLAEYGDAGRIWLTGHSKGGHNAIYAASIDSRCSATGFNSPGFGIFLSDAQHDGLDAGVNYVINGDVTGFLLFHLERRIVLESAGAAVPSGLSINSRHRLNNFFLVDDLTVAARILPLSIASEWVTQILWLLLIFLAVYGLFVLIYRKTRGL